MAVAGRDALLPPLISPGALIQQYFIDAATSETFSRPLQSKVNCNRCEVLNRYGYINFELTISSVRFVDRGSYLGVIGVMDPEGQLFTYERTQQNNVTLHVYGEHFVL